MIFSLGVRPYRGALSLSALPAIGQQRGKRPNILFAIADDQSYLHTSSAGYKAVSTPNIDRVAKTGVRFTHSFCSSPSCTPSRGAILTGAALLASRRGRELWSSLPKKFVGISGHARGSGLSRRVAGEGMGSGKFRSGGPDAQPGRSELCRLRRFHGITAEGQAVLLLVWEH